MSNTILTPSQLWSSYDGEKQPLKTSFLRYERIDNLFKIEAYITAFDTPMGEARAYVYGYRPADIDAPPTAIFVSGLNKDFTEQDLLDAAQDGMIALTFDYMGIAPDKKEYTRYPEDISYANYLMSGDHIEKAVPSAEHTCIYHWVKVCRRVITFARTLTSNDKLGLCGYGNGADICWLAAGFDKRVSALSVMLSAGWREMRNYPRYAKDGADFILNDDSEGWLIGCTSQVYAKYVECPVMFIGTSNSDWTSIDRVDNTLQVVGSGDVHCIFEKCATFGLTPQSVSTAYKWLKSQIVTSKKGDFPDSPTIDLAIEDGKLMAKYSADKSSDIAKVQLMVAKNEVISHIRYWEEIDLGAENHGKKEIPVYKDDSIVFAYVTVIYENGIKLSSYMQIFRIEEDIKLSTPKRAGRMLYDRRRGIREWVVDGTEGMINPYLPKLGMGAMDIQGLTADGGNLSTYVLGTNALDTQGCTIFKFDAYCDEERDICIEMCVIEDKKPITYTAYYHISGGEWCNCTFETGDFKDDMMIPLKDWSDMRKLTFKDISGVVLNNMMWI